MKTYPAIGPFSDAELDKFGTKTQNIKAVKTGEKRKPRRGEWYLSGAIVEAYRAHNDLSTEYYIARLVKVELREVVVME